MKLSFLIILYVLLFSYCAYPQWYSVENGTAGYIRQVKFKDENTGWYVTYYNQVYKTTNGGTNWKCCDIRNIDSLGEPGSMITSGDTLWLASNNGRLLKSNNGGLNWSFIYLNDPNFKIYEFSFLRQNLIYAILYKNGGIKYLIKSTNSGLNWINIYDFSSLFSDVSYINFLNDSIGFSMLHQKIVKTTNYGYNWNVIYSDSGTTVNQFDYLKFINVNVGFLTKDLYNFFRTSNGGLNWVKVIPESYQVRDIIFDNENTGYSIGQVGQNTFYKTTNGGINWEAKTFNFSFGYAREFRGFVKKGNTIYINAVSGGSILKSTNNGTNWFDLSPYYWNTYFKTIAFINSQTGFIGGRDMILLKTTNSGLNWFIDNRFGLIPDFEDRKIKKIQFLNENTGWLLADTGFFKTTNSGVNWQYFLTSIYQPKQFYFIDLNTGWVAKDTAFYRYQYTALYKTTNSGQNFVFKQFFNVFSPNDIEFYDSQYGYIGCIDYFNGPNLYRTTNGGDYWQGIDLGLIGTINIIDRDIAFVGQDGGSIYKTSNGGNTWNKVLNYNSAWSNIKFVNQKTGFAVNSSRNFYFSTNGGDNWNYSYIGSNLGLSDFYIAPNGIAFAVGSEGKIYRTDNYGGIIGIVNISANIPEKNELLQNYPNPFNPITYIKFKIKELNYVILKVYDILGKEIKTLVNESLKAGDYETTFDGSLLPSGIYFYKLSGDYFTETKRMVLAK